MLPPIVKVGTGQARRSCQDEERGLVVWGFGWRVYGFAPSASGSGLRVSGLRLRVQHETRGGGVKGCLARCVAPEIRGPGLELRI